MQSRGQNNTGDTIKLLLYLLTTFVCICKMNSGTDVSNLTIENVLKGSGLTAVSTEAGNVQLGTVRMALYIVLKKMRFGLP